MPDAAEHHHGDDHHRLHQGEGLRGDKALEGGEQRARHTTECGAHTERGEFEVAGVDAHGLGCDLVFADRHPGAPDARDFQAVRDHDAQQHQGQKQVVVERNGCQLVVANHQPFAQIQTEKTQGINLAHTLGAVGDVVGVVHIVQEHPDDFAKAQGHDGQVVTAQAQGRRAQQDAKDARHYGRQRQHHPDWRVQTLGVHGRQAGKCLQQVGRIEQPVDIGTDGEKSHIAQVQQAGVAHHNVQTNCQQHKQQGHVGNAHPGIAKELQDQGQNQQPDTQSQLGRQVVFDIHVHVHVHRTLTRGRPHVRPTDPMDAA